MTQVYIDRQRGYWLFVDDPNKLQTEYVTLDKNGDAIMKGIVNVNLSEFIDQKKAEGFEKF